MSKVKLVLAAAALCGGLTVTAASAMPIAPVPTDSTASVEHVRWVCGPYGRCWWRPNYSYGYYGYAYAPRPYWRHRHWRHHYW